MGGDVGVAVAGGEAGDVDWDAGVAVAVSVWHFDGEIVDDCGMSLMGSRTDKS